jgi:hypothetical protein
VAVGGSLVSVGGTAVSVGVGVSVGRAVGLGSGVLVVEGMGVNVGLKVFTGSGVAVGAVDRKLDPLQPRLSTPKIISANRIGLCFIVCSPQS